jgi:hypothetical protein
MRRSPKNAWTTLSRRPRLDIREWRRTKWRTRKGETLFIEYGYFGRTRFRYYQHLIYPDGTSQWRFCVEPQTFTKEERSEFEKRWLDNLSVYKPNPDPPLQEVGPYWRSL